MATNASPLLEIAQCTGLASRSLTRYVQSSRVPMMIWWSPSGILSPFAAPAMNTSSPTADRSLLTMIVALFVLPCVPASRSTSPGTVTFTRSVALPTRISSPCASMRLSAGAPLNVVRARASALRPSGVDEISR